jgi:hypothetical protein
MEEHNLFMDMFSDLLRSIVSRDLTGALECGETMAALDSREKQKAFCNFAGDCIRKIFMVQQNMKHIAGLDSQEEEFFSRVAGQCGNAFCTRTIANIEKVVSLIDRNVNSKILFCDLVNRMFLSV